MNRRITWWTTLGCFALAVVTIIVLAYAGDPAGQSRSMALLHQFQERWTGYSIRYPADWVYEKPDKVTVVFSGKRGTDDYYTTVSLQNVLTARAGGKHPDVASLVDDLREQFRRQDSAARFADEKPFAFTAEDGTAVNGASLVASYRMYGKQYQQWVAVIPRASGEAFHVFFYTSPTEFYARNTKVAADMFTSWRLQKSTE